MRFKKLRKIVAIRRIFFSIHFEIFLINKIVLQMRILSGGNLRITNLKNLNKLN
jgi:hypothetical protein